ncbi:MAG: EamA family transporter [Candidatus Sungbacteria bacterium]|uniref:EamA family transporter n=1 Tax=Candidatus Sungiibacteriota bacterium TaxID=2750080 RepID=A0A9D6QY94_9BACT|nr:EamA family transporter [Candidatus Sungbacteria bacterium]
MLKLISLLLFTSATAVLSQILFKRGVRLAGPVAPGGEGLYHLFLRLLSLPSFIIALISYGLSFIVWILLLSKTNLSLVYPVGIGLNVIFILIFSQIVLGEPIRMIQLLGVALIIGGIFVVLG